RFELIVICSRRRHTITKRDWSLDVCSSDRWTEKDEDAKEAKDIVQKALGEIPEVKEMTEDGSEQLNSAMGRINQAEELLDELGPKISEDLAEAQSIVHEVNEAIDNATENIGVEEDLDEKIDEQVEKLD